MLSVHKKTALLNIKTINSPQEHKCNSFIILKRKATKKKKEKRRVDVITLRNICRDSPEEARNIADLTQYSLKITVKGI